MLDKPLAQALVGPQVFLSHRNFDKPVVRALATLLSALDIHYWLDEEDQDIQRAVALGLIGDTALVHAIERGVKHSSVLTQGSSVPAPRALGGYPMRSAILEQLSSRLVSSRSSTM